MPVGSNLIRWIFARNLNPRRHGASLGACLALVTILRTGRSRGRGEQGGEPGLILEVSYKKTRCPDPKRTDRAGYRCDNGPCWMRAEICLVPCSSLSYFAYHAYQASKPRARLPSRAKSTEQNMTAKKDWTEKSRHFISHLVCLVPSLAYLRTWDCDGHRIPPFCNVCITQRTGRGEWETGTRPPVRGPMRQPRYGTI